MYKSPFAILWDTLMDVWRMFECLAKDLKRKIKSRMTK